MLTCGGQQFLSNFWTLLLCFAMDHGTQITGMSHIFDDFTLVTPAKSLKCPQDLTCFFELVWKIVCAHQRWKKLLSTTTIIVRGIEVDSHKMECRLPNDKIKIKKSVNDTYSRKYVRTRELQFFIGLLNFVFLVVCPGRPFLSRLIDLTFIKTKSFYFVRLNQESRANLATWKFFIDSFNGTSVFLYEENWFGGFENKHCSQGKTYLG